MVSVLVGGVEAATATAEPAAGVAVPAADRCHTFVPGADLHDCNLDYAKLDGANLHGATLYGADVERAEFARAHLNGADPTHANAPGTGFADANLTGATITGWKINFFTVFRGTTWIDGTHCAIPSQGACD